MLNGEEKVVVVKLVARITAKISYQMAMVESPCKTQMLKLSCTNNNVNLPTKI